jgi:hypothetical protein
LVSGGCHNATQGLITDPLLVCNLCTLEL